MYCKYCGKHIDDDSKFCKECGKNLVNDISKSDNSFSISKIKSFIIPICIILIWYALTFVYIFGVYDNAYEDESPIGILVLLWITPIVYYLTYTFLNKYSKYPFKLWDETDKVKTKVFKLAYMTYSYFIPFVCCEDNIGVYLCLMFIFWFILSLLIYLIYYLESSKLHKRAH